jgi:hypothetical protein
MVAKPGASCAYILRTAPNFLLLKPSFSYNMLSEKSS